MTALIFVVLVGREAVKEGLGLVQLARLVPYLLPQAMQFAVPGTMLLAATSVYGKLAANNEMVAAKSMGISPWALVWPTLVLATIVSLGAVLLNDIAVSWGRLGQQKVILESIESVTLSRLKTHGNYSNGKLRIKVRRVDGERMIQPTVTWQSSPGKDAWNITADWAELDSRPKDAELVIRFFNVLVDGPVNFTEPGVYEHLLPLEELTLTGKSRSPSTYALSEIGPAITEQQQRMTQLEEEMTTQAAYAMLTGDMQQLAYDAWLPNEAAMGDAQYKLQRFRTEPHRRWASGFSCLAFVMVGIPVAVIFRMGQFLTSFFICFLPILIVYYPLLILSVGQAKNGNLPPGVVWIGNLTLALVGLLLMRRVERY